MHSVRCPSSRRSSPSRRARRKSRATTSTSPSRSTASSVSTPSFCRFRTSSRSSRGAVSTLTRALSLIDPDELVALTRDLVRIPSVVRPDDPSANESAVAAHVERWVRAQGFDVEVQDVAPGRPNVLASLGDRAAGPTLLLEGHTDVVTEGDPAAWTHPPFGAALADGKIYGRGAADMKAGLAAAVIPPLALKKSGAAPAGPPPVGRPAARGGGQARRPQP